MTLVDVVVARLTDQLPSRTVYPLAVPDTAPDRYLLVIGNYGAASDDFAVSDALRTPTIWVTSVSIGERALAAREAAWAADRAGEALTRWRPAIGALAWRPTLVTSQPVTRDESLPAVTAMYAVSQWDFQYQP